MLLFAGELSLEAAGGTFFALWLAPDADRVRVDPLDARTSRHLGQCEFASETDAAMLRVLLKVADKGDYDWVESGACGAGWQVSALRRSAECVGRQQLRTGLRIGHAKLGAFGEGVGGPEFSEAVRAFCKDVVAAQ